MKQFSVFLLLMLLVLFGSGIADALTIDTSQYWNGTSAISVGSRTLGQTLTIPESSNVLDSFSFFIAGENISFYATIMEWGGNIPIGPVLYESAPVAIIDIDTPQMFTFNTGGLNLEVGENYDLYITNVNHPELGILFGVAPDSYPYPFGITVAQRFDEGWYGLDDTDLVFIANFSEPTSPVPEPCTMLLLSTGLVCVTVLRRKASV